MNIKSKVLVMILIASSVLAAEVPVYNSIFMAAGYLNGNQHANVLKLIEVLRTQTSYDKAEQLALTLNNAVVDTENKTVKYIFVDIVDKNNREQCTFNLVFTVKPGKNGEAQLLEVKANESCQRDD